jgi:REP element-mobilizing transposase RayT
MTRRRRHITAGCTYHVIGRGCRGQPILGTDEDREHFLYLLDEAVETWGWEVANWTLMTNHYHLALTLREANLSEGMHRVHTLFGQRWNERHESLGHVFFRRFTSVEVRSRDQLERLMLYIDINPVRAGLCEHPHDWEWGGYNANVGRRTSRRFHDPDIGLVSLVQGDAEPAELRFRYARRVSRKIAQVRGIGTPADIRPTLEEILDPGDVFAMLAANELWGYSSREIARHTGRPHTSLWREIKDAQATREAIKQRGQAPLFRARAET